MKNISLLTIFLYKRNNREAIKMFHEFKRRLDLSVFYRLSILEKGNLHIVVTILLGVCMCFKEGPKRYDFRFPFQ